MGRVGPHGAEPDVVGAAAVRSRSAVSACSSIQAGKLAAKKAGTR